MKVYRKSLVIQLLLFTMFFAMGAYTLGIHYLGEAYPWIVYVIFGLLIVLAIVGFIIYRSSDNTVVVITEKELRTVRYLIYGYFAVYLLQMIISSRFDGKVDTLEIIALVSGVLLMTIAIIGVFLQYRVLRLK